MVVNRTELADLIGCAKTSIDAWVSEGAPVIRKEGRKGVETSYDSRDFIRWLIARETAKVQSRAGGEDLDQLKAEKLKVETEAKQLELAKAKDLVAPVEQVEKAVAKWSIEIRQGMRQIPQRVVTQLIGETDETRFKSVLLAEIDQTLNSLADADLVTESDLEGGTDE